jgi:hypothetical protein
LRVDDDIPEGNESIFDHNSDSDAHTLTDLDIAKENFKFYRHYGLHAFHTPNLLERIQLHIIKDFKLEEKDLVVPIKDRYVNVALLKVIVGTKAELVACCSGSSCRTASLFGFYYDWDPGRTSTIGVQDFYSCHHILPVVQKLRQYLELAIDINDENYCVLLYELIASKLNDEPTDMIPGSWYKDDQIQHEASKGKLSIYIDKQFNLLLVSQKYSETGRRILHCYECPRSARCSHTRLIPNEKIYDLTDLPDFNALLDADLNERENYKEIANEYNIVSNEKYPFRFESDTLLTQTINQRFQAGTYHWYVHIMEQRLVPSTKECCGIPCEIRHASTRAKRCVLFSNNGFLSVDVFCTRCVRCKTTYEYDGREDGIVNFGNSKLFCVEVFMDMLQLKIHSGLPTKAYWASKLAVLQLSQHEDPLWPVLKKEWLGIGGKLNEMMVAFIRLIVFEPTMFQCCASPQAICIDGIVLSVDNQRIASRKLKEPWIKESNLTGVNRFSTRSDRQLITLTQEEKEMIKEYILIGITKSDFVKLKNRHLQSPLIKFMGRTSIVKPPNADINQETYHCEPLLIDLFHCQYKCIAPCVAYAPSFIWETLEEIVHSTIIKHEQVQFIDSYSKVMGRVCLYLSKVDATSPEMTAGILLISKIVQIARNTFNTANRKYNYI